MGEIARDIARGLPWYMYAALAIASGLMVASFCLPPTGKIDPSVLEGVGILLVAVWLYNFSINLPAYIEAGAVARVKHGETELSIGKGNEHEHGHDGEF